MLSVLSIFGTRPEAIKMAPLLSALRARSGVRSQVCVTGQHRTMLQGVLDLFAITPDHQLDVMVPNQSLNGLSARLYAAIDPVLEATQPDVVLVHGDTTTALVAAMAAFHRRIDVGHVEAGLRTYDLQQPWPEEMNRRQIDIVSRHLFAPTVQSKTYLAGERLSGRIVVTGNTVIDALRLTVERIEGDAALRNRLDHLLPTLDRRRKLLLVTGHRRENFGQGFEDICTALARLARRPDIEIVYPVHLNPAVREVVLRQLSGLENIHLIEPLDYLKFVRLMQRAHVVLTDSGGVQEEAPALGKPVLVMRNTTERPEAVHAGTVQLVGTASDAIVDAVNRLFDSDAEWQRFAKAANPYGDGYASSRIVSALLGEPFDEFSASASVAHPLSANSASAVQ